MASEVITAHSDQELPDSWDACILVGELSANLNLSERRWQHEVIDLLRKRWTCDGRLVVLIPEPRHRDSADEKIIDWYVYAADIADVAMFWWPNEAELGLMFSSLAAWGDNERVVYGTPSHLPQSRYLLKYAGSRAISTATSLAAMVSTVLDKIGSGAHRRAGEREVPLPIWRTDSFQRWHAAQASAGNTLLGARRVWTLSVGPEKGVLLYWALRVRVYIRREGRVKTNEVVISRPDISVVALYRRGVTIDDTTIVLVREFRSPASTPDGLVHELPGGSGTSEAAIHQAVRETLEETGIALDVRRVQARGSRQLAATVSAHHAYLFTVEITSDELARLRVMQSAPHGVANETEQTWIEISTFSEIRENRLVDWATLGMIADVVLDTAAKPPIA